MSDRENFEEAAARLGYNLTMAEHETGEYHYPVTQDAWLIWQESQEQAARAQGGQEVEPADVWLPFGAGSAYIDAKEAGKANMTISCELVVELIDEIYRLNTHPQPAQQGSVPDGWKLVPVEPTAEMRYAYHEAYQRYLEGSIPSPDGQWWAMLDAAPQPPAQEAPK